MPFDVDAVLEKLTPNEKYALIAGSDFWHTHPLPEHGVPKLRFSDGPNGVRGITFFNGARSACFPCGTALGATFDENLLQKAGTLMGEEAKAKGIHVILGPTVNIQRSPLGGRGFESFSEDPLLSGKAAAAVIKGIQTQGVQATIKHFVCNDQEDDRQGVNSVVSQRALREIYLLPFQIAVRDANPGAFMTAYNKVNGTHASENPFLLQDILRKEWKYDGLVMSDWYGVYSTTQSIKAGLSLEMPGLPAFRNSGLLTQAIWSRALDITDIDNVARSVLSFVKKCVTESGVPQDAPHDVERDIPETAKLLRELAADSVVLLKNDNKLLPLSKDKVTAVIGPNAKVATFCGGGSASLNPYYAVTPFDGVSSKTTNQPLYAFGVNTWKNVALIGDILTTQDGKKGFTMVTYDGPRDDKTRKVLDTFQQSNSQIFLIDYEPQMLEDKNIIYADIEGYITPEEDSLYEFSLSVIGTAKLYVDDELVVDNATNQKPGNFFFGMGGTIEVVETKLLRAGQKHKVSVEFGGSATSSIATEMSLRMKGGLRIGGSKKYDTKTEIEKAVEVAKNADQVILCLGLNGEWESEGYDRTVMDLPPNVDSLVNAVMEVNKSVVVVIQSGTPVTLPWNDKVPAIVQAWYGGNETGNGIADVLFGDVNANGKLPLSYPKRVEDNPAYLTFASDHGQVIYGENMFVGYRYYEAKSLATLYPFGHGLSYTKFEYDNIKVSVEGEKVVVNLDITNSGQVGGKETVQIYIAQRKPSTARPVKELKGFTKVDVKAGEKKNATIEIPLKYATSYWHEAANTWISEADTYKVYAAASSQDVRLEGEFKTEKTVTWRGL